MASDPEWIELTKAVGEINARLIAGELENEGIRVHLEMDAPAWFYGAEDPNRLATIYVLAEDFDRAEQLLDEPTPLSEGDSEDLFADADPELEGTVFADQDRGLRARPLRWVLAAVIAGVLLFGYLKGDGLGL